MPAEESRRRVNRTLGHQTHLISGKQAQELAGKTRTAIGGDGKERERENVKAEKAEKAEKAVYWWHRNRARLHWPPAPPTR